MTRLYAGLYPKEKPKSKYTREKPLKKVEAVIKDIKIYTNNTYLIKDCNICHSMTELTEEPEGQQDLVLVTMRAKGKDVTEAFPVIIKYDGMLQKDALTSRNRSWRYRFVKFLRDCGVTASVEEYNIPANIGKLIGKKLSTAIES